jgi:hypothetical protein
MTSFMFVRRQGATVVDAQDEVQTFDNMVVDLRDSKGGVVWVRF